MVFICTSKLFLTIFEYRGLECFSVFSFAYFHVNFNILWWLTSLNAFAVAPDFAQVYSFIGSVFDPNATGHLQKLKQMDSINLETVGHFNCEGPFFIIINWGMCAHILDSKVIRVLKHLFHHASSQALLLMRNLTVNLTSPEFEDHVSFTIHISIKLLSVYFWKWLKTKKLILDSLFHCAIATDKVDFFIRCWFEEG